MTNKKARRVFSPGFFHFPHTEDDANFTSSGTCHSHNPCGGCGGRADDGDVDADGDAIHDDGDDRGDGAIHDDGDDGAICDDVGGDVGDVCDIPCNSTRGDGGDADDAIPLSHAPCNEGSSRRDQRLGTC